MMRLFCFAATLAQDQENLPEFQQDRCFKCGSAAHYSADCAIAYEVSVAFLLQPLSDCFSYSDSLPVVAG